MYLSTEDLISRKGHHSFTHPVDIEYLHEQGSGELNEDVILTDGTTIGVFDGATSLSAVRFKDGKSGGLLAAEIAADCFRDNENLKSAAEQANRKIAKAQQGYGIHLSDRIERWSTSMAVVRMGEDSFEYCQSGDAQIIIIYEDGNSRVITSDFDHDRETLSMWKELGGDGSVPIYELLGDQIKKVRREMNVTYGVLNGEPEAMNFVDTGCHSLKNVSDILIFTDGLFLPKTNPAAGNDWQQLVSLYRSGGLNRIRSYVREMQAGDPGCIKFPRFKIHDDIAAIAISR